jgi:8-oxo-dGTP diphosphatase
VTPETSPDRERRTIVAAGGVVWRRGGDGIEVVLVHRPKYDDWSLPKGKVRADEHPLVGACREVREETGLCPVVRRRLTPEEHYPVGGRPKGVHYWEMRASAAPFSPTEEVDAVEWVRLEGAQQRLSYRQEADLLAGFGADGNESVVLLVRHARAADPERWVGQDHARPLDDVGLVQVEALRRAVPLFGPARILSPDVVRCVQTIAPVADDLSLPIDLDNNFDEEVYSWRPHGAHDRIRQLARGEGCSVVCTQGMVIPHVIADLAEEDGLFVGDVPAKKGSVWALFFSDGRLAAADYYPSFSARKQPPDTDGSTMTAGDGARQNR